MTGLTTRQREAMLYLQRFASQHHVAPTMVEMAEGLNLSSKSSVVRLLRGLEDRGYIRRLAGKARAIEILKSVGGDSEHRCRDLVRIIAGFTPAGRDPGDDAATLNRLIQEARQIVGSP